ncbi:MAG TPA: VOC family protein, partial [Vicinamibacterales bacterium]|nr:VOC family protein [Vicinamibacterales bacterium]
GDTTAWWRWFNRAFRRTALIPAFALSATAAASSQVTQTAVTPLKDLASAMYAPMSKNLLAAAAAMPEDRYDFRVTPDVRSFGQMIAHVAGSQFLYCSTAAGTRLEPSMLARLGVVRPYSEAPSGNQLRMSKADVVALLRDGVGYCRIAHDKVLEGNILEQVKLGGQNVSRLQAFLENAAHNNHHYGNLVAYLRLNGVVPPSSVAEAAQPVSQEIRGPRLALTRVTILVRDQDEALQFYTEKLGMEKRLDQAFAGAYAKPAGGAPLRWVTVGPAGQKDIEIVLQKPDRALHGDRVDEMTSQIGRGPTWAFATDNCERAYEELRRRGVRFLMPPQKQPWGTQAIFEDLYGNSFALVEAPR